MRSALVVLVLAGCRLHFDDRGTADASGAGDATADGARDAAPDAGPVALACNTPAMLQLGTASNPHLSAAAIPSGAYVLWMNDDLSVMSFDVRLGANQATAGTLVNQGGAASAVSAASAATRVLSGGGSVDTTATGGSFISVNDATTGQAVAPVQHSSVRLASARALALSTGGFVLVGVGYAPGLEAELVTLGPTGAPSNLPLQLVAGVATPRVAALPSGFIAVMSGPALPCSGRVFTSGNLGAPVTWGASGQCLQPIAIPSTATGSVLLVRKDTTDGDLNHQVATVSGLTIMLPGEGKLSGVADEPRGVGVGGGYWVAYSSGGQLAAVYVDSGGGVGLPKLLGPVPATDAHDVITFGGEPYAIWFSNGIQLAHLCP